MFIYHWTLKHKWPQRTCVGTTQAVQTETCLLMLENLRLATFFPDFIFRFCVLHFQSWNMRVQIMHVFLWWLFFCIGHGSNVICQSKRAAWIPSTFTSNLTLCSSRYSLHPITMRPTGPYSNQAHCLGGGKRGGSFPPSLLYFLTGLKQRGPLSGNDSQSRR